MPSSNYSGIEQKKPTRLANSYTKKSNNKEAYSKNNTWTATTMSHHRYSIDVNSMEEIESKTLYNLKFLTLQVHDRIEMYEQKYKMCMDKKTNLSSWIESTKAKGPPNPLIEGYSPIPHRSRLHDYFNFSSKQRRKSQIYSQDITSPVVKTSISSLLKKATDSITTTCKQPLKRNHNKPDPALVSKLVIQPISSSQTDSNNHIHSRFSLSNSLNRFSLTKNSNSNTHSESPTEVSSPKSAKYNKRFSTPSPIKISSPISLLNDSMPCSPVEKWSFSNTKARPHSVIIPQSSVFLDRLRTHPHDYQYYPKKYYNTNFFIDEDTPPSSPSSMNSSISSSSTINTLTDSPKKYNIPRHQDIFLHPKKMPSNEGRMQDILEDEEEDHYKFIDQKKKKRSSLLIATSLSSMRFMSQKPNFLRRQSMFG